MNYAHVFLELCKTATDRWVLNTYSDFEFVVQTGYYVPDDLEIRDIMKKEILRRGLKIKN